MAAPVATAQNVMLQGESTAQQRTLDTSHACQNVGCWKQKCKKSSKVKDSRKKPKSQFHHQPGGRKRADEVPDGDPAFDEITIHA